MSIRVTTATLLLLILGDARASTSTLNGVFTQGLFHSDGNSLYGPSEDDISFDFTEASLNASYFPSSGISLSGQVMYRHAGAGFDSFNIDYIYLDHEFNSRHFNSIGLRLGRIKIAYGLLNETRDIAFTRQSIYIPQSIYSDLLNRDTLLSNDGIVFYLDFTRYNGDFTFEVMFGKPNDRNANSFLFGDGIDANVTLGNGGGIKISYQDIASRYQIAWTSFINDNIEASANSDFSGTTVNLTSDASFSGHTLSGAINYGRWSTMVEYQQTTRKTKNLKIVTDPTAPIMTTTRFSSTNYAINETAENAYISQSYHLGDQWRLYAIIDWSVFNTPRKTVDHTLGFEWKPARNVLTRVEYHYVDGLNWLNPAENPDMDIDPERHWNIVTALISLRF